VFPVCDCVKKHLLVERRVLVVLQLLDDLLDGRRRDRNVLPSGSIHRSFGLLESDVGSDLHALPGELVGVDGLWDWCYRN